MADEGGMSDDGQMSLKSGSDVVYDFYCEPCVDVGLIVEAEGFCGDCHAYLCGTCFNVHKSNDHVLLNKDKMPKGKPVSSKKPNRIILTMCNIHPKTPLKFFCGEHHVLGCRSCFETTHRHCSGIEDIFQNSERFLDGEELVEFTEKLKGFENLARKALEKANSNKVKAHTLYTDILKSVHLMKKNIVEKIDKLEKDIVDEAKKHLLKLEKEIKLISTRLGKIIASLETITTELKGLKQSSRSCQAYILMKGNSSQIKVLEAAIRTADEELAVSPFSFELNSQLRECLTKSNAFGKIVYEKRTVKEQKGADKTIALSPTRKNDIYVFSGMSFKSYLVSGSALLSPNQLIVADSENSCIRRLHTRGSFIDKLKLPGKPWDVTIMDRNKIIVSLRNIQKIVSVGVNDAMILDRQISVNGECRGVAYNNNTLLVSFIKPPKLEMMDQHFNVTKTIEKQKDGKSLFQWPTYVCFGQDGKRIYVSDTGKNAVIGLTLDGVVLNEYVDDELKTPGKVCVDRHGNVYACGMFSRNVHLLTADLAKVAVILTQSDGLDLDVYTLSHCQETNRLYFGMKRCYMTVFQLC